MKNTNEPIRDPLLSANDVRRHIGGVSAMTLHRKRTGSGFPAPTLVMGKKNYWRLSVVEGWLAQVAAQSVPVSSPRTQTKTSPSF